MDFLSFLLASLFKQFPGGSVLYPSYPLRRCASLNRKTVFVKSDFRLIVNCDFFKSSFKQRKALSKAIFVFMGRRTVKLDTFISCITLNIYLNITLNITLDITLNITFVVWEDCFIFSSVRWKTV